MSDGEFKLSFSVKDTEKTLDEKIEKAQKFVDSEAIRQSSPYVPFRNGMLDKSAILGTVIGSGNVVYASVYARYQYYGKLMVSSITGSAWAKYGEKKVMTDIDLKYSPIQHPLAGSFWFERMKKDHAKEIEKGAQKIINEGH